MNAVTLRPNYRVGTIYSLATATLLAVQEPFSALAARSLSSAEFVCLTQIALLLSVPLMTVSRDSRRDFAAVLFDARNLGRLAIIFIVGMCGLILYNIGLSSAHPIITAGVLNSIAVLGGAGRDGRFQKVDSTVSFAVLRLFYSRVLWRDGDCSKSNERPQWGTSEGRHLQHIS